ncbi:hypothetical protein ACFQLX_13860 [Streptomyces polyrhachis]|uniref:Uncharacterized protein n=1 Tax=Streptomyces polyrhachis TaxID=1282885 RepID=A0ABW2GGM2_9ACTN
MPDPEEPVVRLQAATFRYERAKKATDEARGDLHSAIAAALRAGLKPRAVSVETGLTPEHIRRIAREHGVPPLREPTKTSRRRAEEPQD